MVIIYILLFLILSVLLTAFICFMIVFYFPKRKVLAEDEFELPSGEIYEPYRDIMIGWMKQLRSMPHEDMEIKSFDGLTLRGKYYECKPGAPVELMFHGYQGSAERDLCGGVFRCFALERNVVIIDHRASGTSDGNVITFGINEHRDCLNWIDHAIKRFGSDVKLILTGISMGAATVMTTAGKDLPDNVMFVLADCGYTSAREIIKKVIRDLHLPANLLYPFVKLGARIFGRFDLEETSPIEAMKNCRVPVIFFHGDNDNFVPCEMSRALFETCSNKKKLVVVHGAGHGLCYPIDKENYLRELKNFELELVR